MSSTSPEAAAVRLAIHASSAAHAWPNLDATVVLRNDTDLMELFREINEQSPQVKQLFLQQNQTVLGVQFTHETKDGRTYPVALNVMS
jgi:hypothetical protein